MLRESKVNWSEVFPHKCKIYRKKNEDEFTDGTVEVIYEGECRDEGNKAMRTYQTDGVMKSDHALQIPYFIKGVTNECLLDLTNDCVSVKGLFITNCQPLRYGSRAGTTVMYNEAKN